MNKNTIRKIIGFIVFLITAVVYFSTVQRSVSFWDCGEFIASSNLLQVPHPPGTPFFLILGRLFAMIPFVANIGFIYWLHKQQFRDIILFLYLIAVRLIEQIRKTENDSMFESVATYIAAAIGALSLAFGSTFWFNGMEAEVYASATFFISPS